MKINNIFGSLIKKNKFNEKETLYLLDKYVAGAISDKETQKFLLNVCNFCYRSYFPNEDAPFPTISFEKLESEFNDAYTTFGYHDSATKSITINFVSAEKNDIKAGETDKIVDFLKYISVIGHEFQHHKQLYVKEKYEKLSEEEKDKIGEVTKKILTEYEADFNGLEPEETKILYETFTPYLKIPFKKYEDEKQFCASVAFSTYADLLYEKNARDAGYSFTKEFLDFCKLSKHATPQVKNWIWEKSLALFDLEIDELGQETDRIGIQIYANKLFNMDNETIIKTINLLEKSFPASDKIDTIFLQKQLRFLIKNKSIEEKFELLENAIHNGIRSLFDVSTDLLISDANYYKYKEKIENKIVNYLSNGYINPEKQEETLFVGSYCLAYSKILPEEKVVEVIKNLCKNNKTLFALDFIEIYRTKVNLENKTLSLEFIKTIYQEFSKVIEQKNLQIENNDNKFVLDFHPLQFDRLQTIISSYYENNGLTCQLYLPKLNEQTLDQRNNLHEYYKIYGKNQIYYDVKHSKLNEMYSIQRALNNNESREEILNTVCFGTRHFEMGKAKRYKNDPFLSKYIDYCTEEKKFKTLNFKIPKIDNILNLNDTPENFKDLKNYFSDVATFYKYYLSNEENLTQEIKNSKSMVAISCLNCLKNINAKPEEKEKYNQAEHIVDELLIKPTSELIKQASENKFAIADMCSILCTGLRLDHDGMLGTLTNAQLKNVADLLVKITRYNEFENYITVPEKFDEYIDKSVKMLIPNIEKRSYEQGLQI